MSAMIESYLLDQLQSSEPFMQSVQYKIATNPATEDIIDERVRKHAIPAGLTFVASTMIGSVIFWKFWGKRGKP